MSLKSIFFINLYIPKFTSINPMYQNSASVHIYIQIDISKYMSLKQIYIKIYIFFMVVCSVSHNRKG